MALVLDPNKIEKLIDLGQVGFQITADYSETLYSAEFGDGNVAFARVGVSWGLRTYKLSWGVTYGFEDPRLVQGVSWDNTLVEDIQSRPQYMFRFLYRRFGTDAGTPGMGPLCWIKDPVDSYYRLFRPVNLKPSWQQGDKYDRWGYGEEFRQARAQFSIYKADTVNNTLIAPEYTWPPPGSLPPL